ncbi:SAM and SH3 domain-containing protein 1a isoform X1 [Lates japonicus]|uniref:SAM and SH3 domain-containing protein 1a isoform X1 n=1 Tax=Lates japonicus TaxID=270547 RepID=A0AAD3M8U6_LATJO|nr:SAM and SH3 domain-containing protein 1a isoform X1 [Lates japonicus]
MTTTDLCQITVAEDPPARPRIHDAVKRLKGEAKETASGLCFLLGMMPPQPKLYQSHGEPVWSNCGGSSLDQANSDRVRRNGGYGRAEERAGNRRGW